MGDSINQGLVCRRKRRRRRRQRRRDTRACCWVVRQPTNNIRDIHFAYCLDIKQPKNNKSDFFFAVVFLPPEKSPSVGHCFVLLTLQCIPTGRVDPSIHLGLWRRWISSCRWDEAQRQRPDSSGNPRADGHHLNQDHRCHLNVGCQEAGKTTQAAAKMRMQIFNLTILGINEIRSMGSGQRRLTT